LKKKHRPGAVYRRTKSGKYEDIGIGWRGFPTDGIWLVQNGKTNMACLIGLKEQVPILALNYRLHEQALCERMQKEFRNKNMSLMDEARLCCDYFAEVANELRN
jgi:hypothetical protein